MLEIRKPESLYEHQDIIFIDEEKNIILGHIISFNDDDSVTIQSIHTGKDYQVDKDKIFIIVEEF